MSKQFRPLAAMFFDKSTWLEGIWLKEHFYYIIWKSANHFGEEEVIFFLSVVTETRILHWSKTNEGIEERIFWWCFLWSFIPIGLVFTEEKLYKPKVKNIDTRGTIRHNISLTGFQPLELKNISICYRFYLNIMDTLSCRWSLICTQNSIF